LVEYHGRQKDRETREIYMTETTQKPLNLKEAAAFLGFKPSYVYNLVHYGKIPCYKPSGKMIFFKQEDLEKFIFRGRQAADFELVEQADKVLTGGPVMENPHQTQTGASGGFTPRNTLNIPRAWKKSNPAIARF
jgi:excisionase family DNA binding protein